MLLKNGFILKDNERIYVDLLIKDNKISKIEKNISGDYEVIDCSGCLITPGFIDVHVHFRQPGFEYKETIKTGSLSASKGGYTCVMPMPNLKPVCDSYENFMLQLDAIKSDACIRVIPYASISKNEAGQDLVDFKGLAEAGVFGFSDDGVGIQSAGMMYEAMLEAKKYNKPIVAHCEDNSLLYGGVMHDGKKSRELNLRGIMSISESVQVARDVLLAEKTGVHYHVCHVSAKESVRVIRDAKRANIKVSAEVTPHHLLSCEDDINSDSGLWKMNPPLRSEEDRQALIEALKDNTIDIIASDHAPHANFEKEGSFNNSNFGIVGLETSFALLYTRLVKKGIITLQKLVDAMSKDVARLFDLPYGRIEEGALADIAIIKLDSNSLIDRSKMYSLSNNTPYDKCEVEAEVMYTICDGNLVYMKKE